MRKKIFHQDDQMFIEVCHAKRTLDAVALSISQVLINETGRTAHVGLE